MNPVMAAEPAAPQSFDVCGPLPTGTTVLEASAGTGKTYTIAALAARFIADGIDLDQLLMVTFSRSATNELRMRVRERLVGVEGWLSRVRSRENHPGPVCTPPDQIARLLGTGTTDEIRLRHQRISRALADFDSATIATTHQFCDRMLDGLGILGDKEQDSVLVEDLSTLTREVSADCYLRHFSGCGEDPPFSFDEALTMAGQVIDFAGTELVPAGAAVSDLDRNHRAVQRLRFAADVREEVLRRKARGRLVTYDDMLINLQLALSHPVNGEAAARRLRDRYQVVLVDEFQDTDPIQWDILRRAFHTHSRLILIGDPKQAIYAFRGADVFSYLQAVSAASHVATLATNWRADAALVAALDTLFGGAALGNDKIVVRPVTAHHRDRRLFGLDPQAARPVRLRVLADEQGPSLPKVGQLRPRIIGDLVADIAGLLGSGAQLNLPSVSGGDRYADRTPVLRPVTPADIAVLVRTNKTGERVRQSLSQHGIPAVLTGATSVYATDIAEQWATLLRALDQPRQVAIRRASLTCFVGWSFADLARADEEKLTELSRTIRLWSKIISAHGVAALLEAVTFRTALARRVLSRTDGERTLTDLRHIGQSLHAAMVSGQLGVTALLEWLEARMSEARSSARDERTRRLETDAKAVQIMTVHGSKGLEFPIVYLPEAWDRHLADKDRGDILRVHATGQAGGGSDAATTASRCLLDVGGRTGPGRPERLRLAREEDAGESLRLLYVALTRAQCQVVTWWAPSVNTPASPLQRLLFGPRKEGDGPDEDYPVSADPFICAHLDTDHFSIERVTERPAPRWQSARSPATCLAVRQFNRTLDLDWRRTSYSALTAAAHGALPTPLGVGSEAGTLKEDDEPADIEPGAAQLLRPVRSAPLVGEVGLREDGFASISPMSELPSGTQFGTLVHAIYEQIDPLADNFIPSLLAIAGRELNRVPSVALTAGELAEAIVPSLLTPLGPLARGRRLADIANRDRLPELGFELPLTGGDHPRAGRVRLGQVAALLRRYLPAGDALADYPNLLDSPLLAQQPLRGYLTGSIDAVLRVHHEGDPRYLVVDYKTNWLGDFSGAPLTLGDYAPPLLAGAMMQAHYPLQALLYSVAVHRFLRWRQPGYDPAKHLGGVLYLFVRGMGGPDTPAVGGVPCGVFSWLPPAELIATLSTLLDGETNPAGDAGQTGELGPDGEPQEAG